MSLRAKLVALLIACVSAPLVAAGWLGFSQLRESIEREAATGALDVLNQVQLRAMAHRESMLADVRLFADSPLVRNYLLVEDERDRYTLHAEGLLALFASYQRARPDYYEIRLLLPDGYEDVRSTPRPMPNVTDEEGASELFRLIADSGEESVSLLRRNPDNGEPALYVAQRIELADIARFGASAKPVLRGYLVVTSALDFLAVERRRGDGLELLYTDAAGVSWGLGANGVERALAGEVGASTAARGAREAPRRIAVGDDEYLLVGRELAPDLLGFAALPAERMHDAAGRLAGLVALVTAIAIVITAALLFRVLSALLLDPLHKLGRAARAVGRGELVESVGIARGDEIGELARHFEEMSGNLRQFRERAHFLAHHDTLTGLPNRRLFREQLDHAVAHARRAGNGVAVLFIDLDDFKRVNDTLGHQAGDELLQRTAERMLEVVRGTDWVGRDACEAHDGDSVARLGGDEFIVLLPDIAVPTDAAAVAQRVLDALSRPFPLGGHEFQVGASVGITTFPGDGASAEELVRNGDAAMYHAKSLGKGNYQFYDANMNEAARERVRLEGALRRALRGDELVLHYQPQYDVASGEIVAFEALVRWQHPERGLLLPGSFIRVAEESGLVRDLGQWVLDRACRQAREWRDAGLPPVRMCVNVSNVQFKDPHFGDTVERTIAESGLDPTSLEIELTETSVMESESRSKALLSGLKRLGVTVAMDDFGTGHSSLAALRRLPLDVLKIDRSFVRDIEIDSDDDAIVAAIVSMGRTLGLRLVAEGVETHAQLERIRACGCHVAQGFLLARPLTPQDARALLAGRNTAPAAQAAAG